MADRSDQTDRVLLFLRAISVATRRLVTGESSAETSATCPILAASNTC